jgi:hypothetical protein
LIGELAGLLDNPCLLEDVKEINPARHKEYEENMEHFTMFAYVFKCKELGLSLHANDFDVEQIDSMYEIMRINIEKEKRKAKAHGR